MLAQREGPWRGPWQVRLAAKTIRLSRLSSSVMRSATWSRQKPDPGLRARLGTTPAMHARHNLVMSRDHGEGKRGGAARLRGCHSPRPAQLTQHSGPEGGMHRQS